MIKIFTILVLVLLFAFGCSDDPVSSVDTEATFYYRSIGTGTVKIEIYETSIDDKFFMSESLELTRADLALNIVPNNEIIPLATGNKWVYLRTTFDSLNTELGHKTDSFWVGRDTTIDNNLWFIIRDVNGPFQISSNMDDGYYARDVFTSSNGTVIDSLGLSYLAAKYPANIGEVIPNRPGFIVEVLSTNESVTVPAGAFTCYKYKRTEQ